MLEKDRKNRLGSFDQDIVEEKLKKTNGEQITIAYQVKSFLGKGGFAKVYEFVNFETKKIYAAKVMAKASFNKARLYMKTMNEIRIHKSLNHKHIVKLEHYFEDKDNVYILLELCKNQSLNELLKRRKRLTETELRYYIIQIVSALKYVHSLKIIHRDIKLANLFLNDKLEIKLGDFGLATKVEFEGERKRTICGTPNYIAPEIIDEGRNGHSYEVDVWSLGALAYTLAVGRPPFETNDVRTTYKRIKMNIYGFPDHIDISDDLKSFVRQLLVTNPTCRPSLDDIIQMDFLSKYDIPKNIPVCWVAIPPPPNANKPVLRPKNMYEDNRVVDNNKDELKNLCKDDNTVVSDNQTIIKNTVVLKENITEIKMPLINEDKVSELNKENKIGCYIVPAPKIGFESSREILKKKCKKGQGLSLLKLVENKPDTWVKQWIDCCAKFGLLYVISDKSIGILFNDNSRMISNQCGTQFRYKETKASEEINFNDQNRPKKLSRKAMILDHFRKKLIGK